MYFMLQHNLHLTKLQYQIFNTIEYDSIIIICFIVHVRIIYANLPNALLHIPAAYISSQHYQKTIWPKDPQLN